jgi:hypothetical protein
MSGPFDRATVTARRATVHAELLALPDPSPPAEDATVLEAVA